MSLLTHAIESLIEKIENGQVSTDQRISLPVNLAPDFSAIDWLQQQTLYPRFYWQSRDQREEVIALEKIVTFTDPIAAYAVLGSQQRVWGGKAFDSEHAKTRHQSSYFFLPTIELMRQDEHWTLNANVSDDPLHTIRILKKLISTQPSTLDVGASALPKANSVEYTPQFDEWQHILEKALASIEANEFEKVVLARKTTVELEQPLAPTQLLKASRDRNHGSFHFLFSLSPDESFVGSTPERLYCRNGDMLETEALAGTVGRSDDPVEDQNLSDWLLNDDKNLRENQIVVNDIIERLAPYTESVDVQPQAQLIKLRRVQHLKRHIHGNLSLGVKGVQLLGALQPTAAIAGLPREESLNFIRIHEPFTRGWYSGSVGYFGHHKAEFCVAIRSAVIHDKHVKLYAGAGIVPGSEAEFEWQELNRKTATLLNLISDYPIEDEANNR